MKRGAYTRRDCMFVGAWLPIALVEVLDRAVMDLDSDRSKLLRRAIEQNLTKEDSPA